MNAEGRAQAALVAGRLSEERWDVFISSDLRRAREMAKMIAAAIIRDIASRYAGKRVLVVT
ncbi:histidine phosphatase family protein [Paenibacillus hemerocallicola]|uniref:Histidine phosphatase family protein n=1 Tax=Paenibacillus hemerocallicola TaxID=1172614 RepID=A0A5C4T8P1_9BACL|nr:histidine phosphatase family protein [Paenibacillus hemerocallicola]